MLRFLRVICLTICLMIFSAVITVTAESGYKRGDADGDGTVTIRDVTEIQRKLSSISTPNFNEKAADIDGNNLDIDDATNIQRYLAKFDNLYQIGEFFIIGCVLMIILPAQKKVEVVKRDKAIKTVYCLYRVEAQRNVILGTQ